jgi:hypothetical protein
MASSYTARYPPVTPTAWATSVSSPDPSYVGRNVGIGLGVALPLAVLAAGLALWARKRAQRKRLAAAQVGREKTVHVQLPKPFAESEQDEDVMKEIKSPKQL